MRGILQGAFIYLSIVLVLQGCMLAYIGGTCSPVVDEVAHLPAGLRCIQFSDFSLYRVNPPLVKMIAAVPAYFGGVTFDWTNVSTSKVDRNEFVVGGDFIRQRGESAVLWFVLGRYCCIGFALLGTVGCWLWARELFGTVSGIGAAFLWAFSPTVLAWGATILPDVAAASTGLIALWWFYRWLSFPSWNGALFFGFLLGFAELTKMTWIVLYPLLPLLLLISNYFAGRRLAVGAVQLTTSALLSLIVVNSCYGFQGTFTPLKDYEFQSNAMKGVGGDKSDQPLGNRFRESLIGMVPVPLPVDYLQGMDMQRADFETGFESYLFGEWSRKGWIHYYVVAFLFKEPIGLWVLVVCSSLFLFVERHSFGRKFARASFVLAVPLIVVFVLVSSQTGINRNLRYALPSLPLFTVIASALLGDTSRRIWRYIGVLVIFSIGTSVLVRFPHMMSYFNELCGGPNGGHRILMDANVDWGQDMLRLKRWCESHPDRKPLFIHNEGPVAPEDLGIVSGRVPISEKDDLSRSMKPGWYIISRNHLYYRTDQHRYFRKAKPVDHIGYSMVVFNVKCD